MRKSQDPSPYSKQNGHTRHTSDMESPQKDPPSSNPLRKREAKLARKKIEVRYPPTVEETSMEGIRESLSYHEFM